MIIEKKKVTDLIPADYNPRKDLKPGDPEYEKLKRSLEQFGYVEPVIWNKATGRVVGGHQRLKVLIDMGITEVECVVVDLPEDKEKLLGIVDRFLDLPEEITHNGHMYNIILPTDEIRTNLVAKLKEKDIYAYICYVPLHSAPYGQQIGYRPEACPVTEDYGQRVLRLPLYADMTVQDAEFVASEIEKILTQG